MQNEGKHFNHFMEQVILIFIFIETKISLCVLMMFASSLNKIEAI